MTPINLLFTESKMLQITSGVLNEGISVVMYPINTFVKHHMTLGESWLGF